MQERPPGALVRMLSKIGRRSPSSPPPPERSLAPAHFEVYDTTLQKLDLKTRQLECVPASVFDCTSLTWLGLNGNAVTVLPADFARLSQLKVLRALSNRVEVLGAHMGELHQLQVLDLGKNRLTHIDAAALVGMTALKELLLQWNQLTECPKEIGCCTNLRKLQLSINRIPVLPDTLSSLTQLDELDISHNRLTVLPNIALPKLAILNCVGNDLRAFPASISLLVGLTELNAQMNLVEELPSELGHLEALRKLKLKKNLIREFPREIGGLTSLEELLISDNQFINLPRTIGQLKKLSVLRASENAFIYLPPELGDLPSLRELDLSFNQIETLPREFGKLQALQTAVLGENSLIRLPREIGNMTSLVELNVFNNKLTDVPPELGDLRKLKKLSLSRNRIAALPDALSKLTALETFDCACNLLENVPDGLAALPSLTHLNVASNSLPHARFLRSCLPTLRVLHLGYNPLDGALLEVEQLTNLIDLNLSGLGLRQVPQYLSGGMGASLNVLALNNNLIPSLPSFLTVCTSLQVLQLSGNCLSELSVSPLSAMRKLRELDVAHNSVKFIDGDLLPLLPLQDLDLSANLLSSLPSSLGTSMPSLTQLKVAYNSLTRLPAFPPGHAVWISHHGNPLVLSLPGKKTSAISMRSPRTVGRSQLASSSEHANNERDKSGEGWASSSSGGEKNSSGGLSNNNNNNSGGGVGGGSSGGGGGGGRNGVLYSADLEARALRLAKKRRKSATSTGDVNSGARLAIGWAEMTGKRPDQQDTIAVIREFAGDPNRCYFGVFDGHGGQTSSEYAASYLHVLLEEALSRTPLVNEAMQTAFREMHEEIVLKGFDDGCAALMVYLTPDRIWLANAGDSRAIMCRKGRAVQISRDHKSDSIDEKKRIQALHGFITEDRRVNGILALSRALGDTEQQPHVTYRPDVLEMDVSDAIEYLILACDGLWDVLSNEQVVEYVKAAESPQAAAIQLRDMAYQLGSQDNISVLVVGFVQQPSSSSNLLSASMM